MSSSFIIIVLLAICAAIIFGVILSSIKDRNTAKETNSDRYNKAVKDIICRHCYWDSEENRYVPVAICSIDGCLTKDYKDTFDRCYMEGYNAAIGTMVMDGVIDKQTGNKFRHRFRQTYGEQLK